LLKLFSTEGRLGKQVADQVIPMMRRQGEGGSAVKPVLALFILTEREPPFFRNAIATEMTRNIPRHRSLALDALQVDGEKWGFR
jgi:hypothetical protein